MSGASGPSGESVAAAALAWVCGAWEPARIAELVADLLLAGDGTPAFGDALAVIRAGERSCFGLADVEENDWATAVRRAQGLDARRVARLLADAEASVLWPGAPTYPEAAFADADPPPGLLMAVGDLGLLHPGTPRVAVVGTRTPTVGGAQFAFALGRDLARAGVGVVSGLARGIDAAAHRGALQVAAGRVVGIVGSGLDVVYPAEHRELWAAVRSRGVLLTETALGERPDKRRFTHRNRLLAAAADAVVVVESAASGGSLSTAAHALMRGRPLLAVPGTPWSSVSAGTNRLLERGRAMPCHGVRDVLRALPAPAGRRRQEPAPLPDGRPVPAMRGARVLRALGWESQSVVSLAARVQLPIAVVGAALADLQRDGWVARGPHGWFQLAGDRSP